MCTAPDRFPIRDIDLELTNSAVNLARWLIERPEVSQSDTECLRQTILVLRKIPFVQRIPLVDFRLAFATRISLLTE